MCIRDSGYTVTITYVAEVGGQKYATLAAAIQAADNNIVKLLEDVTLDETLTIEGKTLTLDLNGKIISGSVATNGLINATMGTQLSLIHI